MKDRPVRGGRVLPVEASDFASRSALFLPREAQYAYLVELPENIPAAGLTNWRGEVMNSLGEVVEQRHGVGGAAERAALWCAAQGLHHVL